MSPPTQHHVNHLKSTSGMLVINKPVGMISKDVSRWLIKRFGKLKIGHVGTLDPGASGVLPILIGKATRLQDYLLDLTKSYEFDVEFGYETDTLDFEGEVTKRIDFEGLDESKLLEAVMSLKGMISQIPPLYSAIKYKGKPLYEYARSGNASEVPLEELTRKVEVYDIKLLGYQDGKATVSVSCSKGTYVRVLAKDIAEKIGTYGTVTRLVRTRAAGVDLKKSYSLEEIDARLEEIASLLTPLEQIEMELPHWVSPNESIISKLSNGQEVVIQAMEYLEGLKGKKVLPEAFAMPMVLLNLNGNAYGMGTSKLQDMGRVKINLKRGL